MAGVGWRPPAPRRHDPHRSAAPGVRARTEQQLHQALLRALVNLPPSQRYDASTPPVAVLGAWLEHVAGQGSGLRRTAAGWSWDVTMPRVDVPRWWPAARSRAGRWTVGSLWRSWPGRATRFRVRGRCCRALRCGDDHHTLTARLDLVSATDRRVGAEELVRAPGDLARRGSLWDPHPWRTSRQFAGALSQDHLARYADQLRRRVHSAVQGEPNGHLSHVSQWQTHRGERR